MAIKPLRTGSLTKYTALARSAITSPSGAWKQTLKKMTQASWALHHQTRAGTDRAGGPVTAHQPPGAQGVPRPGNSVFHHGAHTVTVVGKRHQAAAKPDPVRRQLLSMAQQQRLERILRTNQPR
ncbi:MAG TPA: hypothetical protein VE673_06415 [Pseudonocardiaceae bacterium]|nr:hypothetical protein [Pseudonocardiaceae bacterium]